MCNHMTDFNKNGHLLPSTKFTIAGNLIRRKYMIDFQKLIDGKNQNSKSDFDKKVIKLCFSLGRSKVKATYASITNQKFLEWIKEMSFC